jgi:beta-glucosidase
MNKAATIALCALIYLQLSFTNRTPAIISPHHSAVKDTSGCNCDVTKEMAMAKARKKNKNISSSGQKPAHATVAVPKYLDPKVPIEERITDLLPRLTLEEKVIELSDSWGSKGIPRLKIPAMLKTEGLHSQSYSTGATLYPQPISMATTFDPDLIDQVGKATAVEAKSANLRSSWSPVLDVARDARWGRVEETYGEAPYLVSRMGVAWIHGFQGEGMIAVPKHFAGHGEPLGGRDSHDVGLSDRVMRNIHLVPFRAAVEEAHVGGVMAAYSTWNAVPDNGSTDLLQKILREEWEFDGYVVSDCSGPENFLNKQSVVGNLEEASRMAIHAGVDIECGSAYKKALASAVSKGYLNESDLNANLRRVFRAKFKLGLFENPGPQEMVWDKLPGYDTPEHRALAHEVSVEGSVLLKNDAQLLPLKKDIKTIAVIGPNADVAQTGDYSPKIAPNQLVTVLQGIRSHVSAATKVLYAKGCDVLSSDATKIAGAVEVAKQADVVVLVVGDNSHPGGGASTTGENNDGATLEIPGSQRQLIREIQATGKPIVLVLVNGKPFTLAWEAEHIPAILETWYPGEEGGNATADLLFGDRNPSGRLPITLPRHVGQLPLTYDFLPSGRNYNYFDMPFTPQYRFGYGLSYTRFKYSNLVIANKKNDPGSVTVSADVENTGERDGDEVTQLYVTDVLTSVITPVIQLGGIKRLTLKKGEKKTVTFGLTPYQLSLLNADMVRVLEAGKFRVHVGGASPEPPTGNTEFKQRIGFTKASEGISGEFEVGRSYQANFEDVLTVPANVKGGETFPATVTVKNNGNLLDIADIKIYGDILIDTHRFEIEPGETKTYTFNISLYKSGVRPVSVVLGDKIISKTIVVSKAPAKLLLSNVRTAVGDNGVLHYSASATNGGSEIYNNPINIQVEGKTVASEPLLLAPGEHREVNINYAFPSSGTFPVKIGGQVSQQIIVPGGVSLALKDPLVYLDFEKVSHTSVENEITGSMLTLQGIPQYTAGKKGQAFTTDDRKTFINAGNLDLYRKSFTLATWVNVESFDKGQATFFGGQAPMGADVDITGTILSAGVADQSLMLGFQGRDLKGNAKLAMGKWVHVTYTYDAENEIGSVYINGKLDKTAPQKSYAGPLEMIGASSRANHGKFSMDEVLIARSCLNKNTIQLLADQGVKGLQNGELTTDWVPFGTTLSSLQTSANIPGNSNITIVAEVGDESGKVVDSKTIELKSGVHDTPLSGLKAGTQIRLHVIITAIKPGILPVLQTVCITSSGKLVRWSTTEEWQKSTYSGSVRIGQ